MSLRNPMPEFSDSPRIKLFGRNIKFPESTSPPFSAAAAADSAEHDSSSSAEAPDGYAETRIEEVNNGFARASHKEDRNSLEKFQAHEEIKDVDVKIDVQRMVKSSPSSDEKALKKPDKVVPCPRCNSMETKFCYFNNYNVNQPRHFCKSCQRYWTAGGTIRNVPIGAGHRKNKQLPSQFQPLVISTNRGQVTHVNLLNSADPCSVSSAGLCSPTGFAMETNEVCQNGNDSPLCKSVTTLLTLQDPNQAMDGSGNASREGMGLPCSTGSSAPSAAISTQNIFPNEAVQLGQIGSSGSHITPLPTLQGYPGPQAYPWSMGWNGVAYGTEGGHAVLVPWGFPPIPNVPRFCGPTPNVIPVVPSPYWNWDTGAWSAPPGSNLSPSSSAGNSSCSGNSSPLGKHSRDLNSQPEEATETLWIPKTLRIDDPDEAAKSSIWTTLGIKPGDREPFSKGKPLRDFLRRSEGGNQAFKGDQTLQANPAALSRFKAFQEST